MIKLTKLDTREIVINCELIESVEEVPHTVIRTIHGNKYIVRETTEEIILKVLDFKRRIALAEFMKGS